MRREESLCNAYWHRLGGSHEEIHGHVASPDLIQVSTSCKRAFGGVACMNVFLRRSDPSNLEVRVVLGMPSHTTKSARTAASCSNEQYSAETLPCHASHSWKCRPLPSSLSPGPAHHPASPLHLRRDLSPAWKQTSKGSFELKHQHRRIS